MKVLYIARATLYKDPGGDTIQIVNTAMALEKLGVDVDIRLTNEHFTYGDYDLIHFFNIIRPADILAHIAKSKKPYVVSTIFVDYSEYEKTNRKGIYGLIFKVLSLDSIEYLKAIARSVVNGEAIGSKMYLFYGHRRSIRRIVKNAFALLPNSWSEYQRLSKHYNIERRCFVIPNAINPDLFQYKASPINREANLVLCVARIEGRKNQLNLIKALNHSKFRLVLIGSPSANQHNYYNECKSVAGSNVEFVSKLDQKELVKYYLRAKVHVLPSWFETTGLSSLEAAVLGCNIVVTEKGDTREYFKNFAYYCAPDDVNSIYNAIVDASSNPVDSSLRTKILNNFTWARAAQKTLEVYTEAVGHVNQQ